MSKSRRSSFRSFSEILLSFSLRILFLILLLYVILQGVKLAYSYGHGLMYEHAMEKEPGREVSLEIEEGENSSAVAEKLEKLGLIDNKAGSYSLNTAMTQVDILDFISEEGKKNQELSDKKLLKEGETESESVEEDVVAAGNENEQESELTGGE